MTSAGPHLTGGFRGMSFRKFVRKQPNQEGRKGILSCATTGKKANLIQAASPHIQEIQIYNLRSW